MLFLLVLNKKSDPFSFCTFNNYLHKSRSVNCTNCIKKLLSLVKKKEKKSPDVPAADYIDALQQSAAGTHTDTGTRILVSLSLSARDLQLKGHVTPRAMNT